MSAIPPIPPKQKIVELGPTGHFVWIRTGREAMCMGPGYDNLTAAFCEVEWRKRADRWGKILRFYWHRSRAMKIREAMLLEAAALENAVAWRAWGAQK